MPKEAKGRVDDAAKAGSSKSSKRVATTPPIGKPPKAKRGRGAGPQKVAGEEPKKKASKSVKESHDKEKESTPSKRGGGRARGRNARGGGARGGHGGPQRSPSGVRPKTTTAPPESFLQGGPCFEVAPRLAKCRECQCSPAQHDNAMPNLFCRFYAFRRLKYTKIRQLAIAGFPDPYKDAEEKDKKLWLSSWPGTTELDIEKSCFLLQCIGDQFCELIQQEKEAESRHLAHVSECCTPSCKNMTIVWKRAVKGVREICDVCDTSLFNFHWTCGKCGFIVCLDCSKTKLELTSVNSTSKSRPKTTGDIVEGWLKCTSGGTNLAHPPRRLLLTQITPGGVLAAMSARVHAVRSLWGLSACACGAAPPSPAPTSAERARTQRLLQEAMQKNIQKKDVKGKTQPKKKQKKNVDDVMSSVAAGPSGATRGDTPIRIMTLRESKLLYPDVPHAWLCDGKLLHLTDPAHPGNYKPFQDQWKRGQPVLVSDVSSLLDQNLWSPESFSRDFGHTHVNLVNCASGLVVPNQLASKFWDGFNLTSNRLRDETGAPMVLKLKDWPTGEDFSELLPARFDDLMRVLPLSEYTSRNGKLNLVGLLPKRFVRPDLGPKMYAAYGGAGGTTNLHVDVSDAVNILVHASAPSDAPQRAREAARDAEKEGVDVLSLRRARHNLPAALWHIYAARDADKIRDFLVRANLRRGVTPHARHDPVHDQTWYLNTALRKRLYREYGVEGYAIVQYPGDAVFVPAGAPHQVRNLLDCIKVAEDFVSPENVSRCFELTQQFRQLSHQHSNKADKLQIKNIVYHAVKESICCLEEALARAD